LHLEKIIIINVVGDNVTFWPKIATRIVLKHSFAGFSVFLTDFLLTTGGSSFGGF